MTSYGYSTHSSFFMVERILEMIDKVYVPPVKIQGIKTKIQSQKIK